MAPTDHRCRRRDKAYVYFGTAAAGSMDWTFWFPAHPAFCGRLIPARLASLRWARAGLPCGDRIPGYKDVNGKPKPVLVFGAGYDPAKDATGVATPDSMGRGLYIVDAETGAPGVECHALGQYSSPTCARMACSTPLPAHGVGARQQRG